jgi:hypothetical protein
MRDNAPPPGIDVTIPSIARVYDYYLGGKDNFAADREFAEKVAAQVPDAPRTLRANREFLRRVVGYLTEECGIRQFLDIGSGLPTQDNVHEVAHRHAPDARVVYVDNDPIVLTHARALLDAGDRTAVIDGDLRAPAAILAAPETRRLLDFSQPVGLLVLTTLFFVADEFQPYELLRTLTEPLVPGSYLAISHAEIRPQIQQAGATFRAEATAPGIPRTREAIAAFFDGFDLVDPGLVPVTAWRPSGPERTPDRVWLYGGVAHKP